MRKKYRLVFLVAATAMSSGGALLAPIAAAQRGGDEAAGPEVQSVFEIVGFSDDGRMAGLKISDEEGRFMYQVREIRRGTIKETIPFMEGQEKKGLRKLKRKGITAKAIGAESDKGIILMSAQKGDKLLIYGMKGETCTKVIQEIKLTKVKESKRTKQPEAFAKQLTWGPRGKHVAIVYHEEYKKTHWWKGDKFASFKFKAYKLSCSSGEK